MVFYFSATGNSKFVAQKISDNFHCKMKDMSQAIKNDEFKYSCKDEERIFFIFPVYYFGLPDIVENFIQELEISGGTPQICGIVTYGTMPGGVDIAFKRSIDKKGLRVSGFYDIKMVENYLMMFKLPLPEEQIMLLRRSDDRLRDIIDAVNFNYRVSYSSGLTMRLVSKIGHRIYVRGRRTKKFHVGDSCIGCGLCQTICPSSAILMEEGKPVWTKEQCSHCTACINRCPVSAINYGDKTVNRGRYINPNL